MSMMTLLRSRKRAGRLTMKSVVGASFLRGLTRKSTWMRAVFFSVCTCSRQMRSLDTASTLLEVQFIFCIPLA